MVVIVCIYIGLFVKGCCYQCSVSSYRGGMFRVVVKNSVMGMGCLWCRFQVSEISSVGVRQVVVVVRLCKVVFSIFCRLLGMQCCLKNRKMNGDVEQVMRNVKEISIRLWDNRVIVMIIVICRVVQMMLVFVVSLILLMVIISVGISVLIDSMVLVRVNIVIIGKVVFYCGLVSRCRFLRGKRLIKLQQGRLMVSIVVVLCRKRGFSGCCL